MNRFRWVSLLSGLVLVLGACGGDEVAESETTEPAPQFTGAEAEAYIGQSFDSVLDELPAGVGASVIVLTPWVLPGENEELPESTEEESEPMTIIAACIGSVAGTEPFSVILGAVAERIVTDDVLAQGRAGDFNEHLPDCVDGATAGPIDQ